VAHAKPKHNFRIHGDPILLRGKHEHFGIARDGRVAECGELTSLVKGKTARELKDFCNRIGVKCERVLGFNADNDNMEIEKMKQRGLLPDLVIR